MKNAKRINKKLGKKMSKKQDMKKIIAVKNGKDVTAVTLKGDGLDLSKALLPLCKAVLERVGKDVGSAMWDAALHSARATHSTADRTEMGDRAISQIMDNVIKEAANV